MSDLSPEARGLIEVARDADEMPSADKARHRKALLAQIAVAGAAGAGTTLAAKTAAAGLATPAAVKTTSAIVTKLIGVAVVAAVVAGGTVAVRSMSTNTPAPATMAAPRPVVTNVIAPTAPVPTALTTPIEEIPVAVPAVAPANGNPRSEANAKPRPSGVAETPRPSSLDEETSMLRSAHEALQAGNPTRALALLDEHARTYPHGLLVEERSAQRILALCALGSTARARAEADVFLTERPNSPLVPRVRTSCIAK